MGLYLALGITYAINTPLFESPDESSHLQVIRYIARERRLPPYQVPEVRAATGPGMAWLIGYHDPPLYIAPPLYHTLAALLTAWTPMDDLSARLLPSPSWEAGFAPQRGSDPWNKNVFVHLPGETLTESTTVRATALLRGISVLLGAAVVLSAYALAVEIWPDRRRVALGAAAWVALNPQFIVGHAGVSNDPLANALCAATLLGVVRLLRTRAAWPRWALLGTLAGLALLTKQSAFLLLPVGGLGALFAAWDVRAERCCTECPRSRQALGPARNHRAALGDLVSYAVALLSRAAAFGTTALLVGGGWYLHNALRYSDPLATLPHYAIQVPLAHFGWQALRRTLESYWVAFGWALITAPGALYAGIGLVGAFAVAGIVKALIHRCPGGAWSLRGQASALLVLAVAVNVVSFVHWATATGAPYGRLLFPTAAPVAVILAWGLAQWRARWMRWGGGVATAGAAVVAALLPWLLLRPAFRSPYRPDGLPTAATPVGDVRASALALIGYEASGDTFTHGDRLEVTLYWRAEAAPGERLTLSAQLRGLDPTARFTDDTRWLGGTLYPSLHWRAGDVVAHDVVLQIPDWAPAPSLVRLDLRLLDEGDALLTFLPGDRDSVTLGPWRLAGAVDIPGTATHADARLGDVIRLEGYQVTLEGDELLVDLYWRATGASGEDYTVFVHWVDAVGRLMAQHDGPPAEGAYPSSWWRAGDVVGDRHVLHLDDPSGDGSLLVGVYVAATGVRLPAFAADGARYPDDAIRLTPDL